MSAPRSTWIGRLSLTVSSRFSAVTMQQEKSRALLRTPERPVRSSVLAILAQMASIRLLTIAICTPSSVPSALRVSVFVATACLPGQGVIRRLPEGRRSALAPGSITTVVKDDSMIAGPATVSPGPIPSKCTTCASTSPESEK